MLFFIGLQDFFPSIQNNTEKPLKFQKNHDFVMPLSVELEKIWLILCQKIACGAKSDQNPENTSTFRPNLVKFHEPKY